jgi:hypothetical protein
VAAAATAAAAAAAAAKEVAKAAARAALAKAAARAADSSSLAGFAAGYPGTYRLAFERITVEAGKHVRDDEEVRRSPCPRARSREIQQGAVRTLLTVEVAKDAVSEGTKAVIKVNP